MVEATNTVVVGIGIFLGAFFSYLLQFFLGKYLSVSDFGTFNALLSLSYLIGVPAAVYGTSLIKKVAELNSKGEKTLVSSLFYMAVVFSLTVGVVVFLLLLVLQKVIGGFLNISDTSVLFSFAFYMSLSFLVIVPYGYLQGLLKYKSFSFFNVFSSLVRFIFPMTLVWVGLGVAGVYNGISLSMVVGFVVALYLLRKNILVKRDTSAERQVKDVLKLMVPIMLTNACMMFLNNIDVLMVKRYFAPDTAGYFTGTVTLGKILLYGAGAVAVVMFPKIATLHASGKKVTQTYHRFIFLQVLIVIIGVLGYLILPKFIAVTFFGLKFIESVKYLPLYAVFIGIYVLINFFVLFLLAVDIPDIYKFIYPVPVIQYLLMSFFHKSPFNILYFDIALASVALVFTFLRTRRAIHDYSKATVEST